MTNTIISQSEAATLIRNSGGKLFGVTFVKRGDRKKMSSTPYHKLPRRKMQGRLGVRKDVNGKGMGYNAANHDLITVHEFVYERGEKGRFKKGSTQWRAVPVEGIEELRIGGNVFLVS